jgi:hypothetical protein
MTNGEVPTSCPTINIEYFNRKNRFLALIQSIPSIIRLQRVGLVIHHRSCSYNNVEACKLGSHAQREGAAMTIRLANWLFLVGFILVGAYYLYDSYQLAAANPSGGFGSVQFPIALGLILIALCVAEFWHSSRNRTPEDEGRLDVPNIGKILATVVLTGLYYFLWSATGQFYPTTAAFFFVLVLMYQESRTLRSAGIAAVVSLVFTIAVFLIFNLAFGIQLS